MTIIWFLILLSPLVFIHELGHFLFAKLFKVKVTAFSLGFGPALWKRKWGETEYKLSAIPLGGYVSMIGEDPNEKLSKADKKRTLSSLPLWKKLLVVTAGPIANFIIPVIIFFIHFLLVTKVTPPVMGTVLPNLPAQKYGLKSGDKVLSINGNKIQTFEQFRRIIAAAPGKKISLTVLRPGKGKVELNLVPMNSVGKNSVGLKQKVGRAGVFLHSTIATIGIKNTGSEIYKTGLRTGDRIVGIKIKGKMHAVKFWPHYHAAIENLKNDDEPFILYIMRGTTKIQDILGLDLGSIKQFEVKGKKYLNDLEAGSLYVSSVSKKGAAYRWGLREGDRIYSARLMKKGESIATCIPAQKPIGSYAEFELLIHRNPKKRICIAWISPKNEGNCYRWAVVKQDVLKSVDRLGNKITNYDMGVTSWRVMDVPDDVPVKNRFLYAVKESTVTTWELTKGMVLGIYYMTTGELESENVGSVVMIAQMASLAADRGFFFFFQIMALISLNLGLLNLLPIPVLDGGHVVIFIIEAIIRKPLPMAVRGVITWIGLGFIVFLMFFGLKNDIVRAFRNKKPVPTRVDSNGGKVDKNLSPISIFPPPCRGKSGKLINVKNDELKILKTAKPVKTENVTNSGGILNDPSHKKTDLKSGEVSGDSSGVPVIKPKIFSESTPVKIIKLNPNMVEPGDSTELSK
jgi:regulator of sigma E protease